MARPSMCFVTPLKKAVGPNSMVVHGRFSPDGSEAPEKTKSRAKEAWPAVGSTWADLVVGLVAQ